MEKSFDEKQFGNPHEDLLKFLPEFDYLLFSLNDFDYHQIANFKNTFLSATAMLLKHNRDEKKKLLAIETFLIEKLKILESSYENDFISAIFYYLHSTSNLTPNEIAIIFTKVSTIVTNIMNGKQNDFHNFHHTFSQSGKLTNQKYIPFFEFIENRKNLSFLPRDFLRNFIFHKFDFSQTFFIG